LGFQTGLDRGFAHYDANRATPLDLFRSNALGKLVARLGTFVGAEQVTARFLRWLPPPSRNRPYFAFLNYLDCHCPYMEGRPFSEPEKPRTAAETKVLTRMYRASMVVPRLPSEHLALAEDAYNGCLRKLDCVVDELLLELKHRGELENTFVVIVSDHGEQFGEHGLFGHSNSLYRPLLHVPLVILGPRHLTPGKRVQQMVSLRDLPATILELLDLKATGMAGDSFASCMLTQPAPKPSPSKPIFAFLSKGTHFPAWFPNGGTSVKAIFLANKYCIISDKKKELYDFENDPRERNNLFDWFRGVPRGLEQLPSFGPSVR
jgi:arylsulfatase A-like enzyme